MTKPRSILALTLTAALAATATAEYGPIVRPGDLGGEGGRLLRPGETPVQMQGVGIEQKLDENVPLDLSFTNSDGVEVTLAELMQPDRPIILTLNYYRCPMLCQQTINGLVSALNAIDWSAGQEFTIITVSFNPMEGPDVADVAKRSQLSQYARPTVAAGWHFLTGKEPEIRALTDAVGFGYKYDELSGEYAHSSTIIFLTPEGRISRYMDDVLFQPKDVRLALVEASEGKIGSPMEKFLLFTCFRFDPNANSYVVSAFRVMRLAALVTIAAIVAGLFVLSRRGPDHRQPQVSLGGLDS